jgi:DNA-binding transcriptional regulator YhcF (GntR family)
VEGWIKLYRSLSESEIWLKEPFTKGQAWVDLLLRINHQDNKIMIGNQMINILKGQTLWSVKDMANRWKWSRHKVQLFLEMLKKEHQIDYKSTTKYTIVTVVNWTLYQNESKKGTSNIKNKDINGTSKGHQKDTNKNDKECINNNISSSNDKGDAELNAQIEELWKLYPKKKGKGDAIKKIPKLIKKYGYAQLKRTIERYSNECKGKDDQYIKHGSTFFNERNGYIDYLDENFKINSSVEDESNQWRPD